MSEVKMEAGGEAVTALKPCPFCGAEKNRIDFYHRLRWIVCEFCGAESGHKGSEEAAIAAWNRRATGWQPIATAPKGEILPIEIDVWCSIYASPRSFGMSDEFRVPNAYWKAGKWLHLDRGQERELYAPYITHWIPLPEPPKEEECQK